jgi:hypothetical protein
MGREEKQEQDGQKVNEERMIKKKGKGMGERGKREGEEGEDEDEKRG